jgi:hypothetical protein
MGLQRLSFALILMAAALSSLVSTRAAIAGKMIFRGSDSSQSVDLRTSFQQDQGLLTLRPESTVNGDLKVEFIATGGRSPAAMGSHSSVLKSMRLTRSISIEMADLLGAQNIPGTIQIRVLAP